jgi:hypothetical protein
MEQNEVRELVAAAQNSVGLAYWDATDEEVKGILMELGIDLDEVFTYLNQEDLASRTKEFTLAADTMSTSVLPGIKKLNERVEKIIQVEGSVKTALADAMKLSQSVSFFSIPALPL